MKLVVGLGNPGRRYATTRHNVGFRVAEKLARDLGIPFGDRRFGGRLGLGQLPLPGGSADEIAILEPLTWMNLSGDAVASALLELPIADYRGDLLVVLDDVDLPFGRLRLRSAGGAGGHRGLAHVISRLAELGVQSVPRLRFGVGRPSDSGGPTPRTDVETANWVLAPFSPEEESALADRVARAAQAVRIALSEGITPAMNRFNRDSPPEQAPSSRGETPLKPT